MLTFPWNYPEIITRAQTAYPSPGAFWKTWDQSSGSAVCFNNLYRDFHQACALPDKELLNRCCESKLFSAVNASVERIHFHGLDIELANLQIENTITVINVEIFHGLSRDRATNGPKDSYIATKSSILGAPCTYYAPAQNDDRHFLDFLDNDYKPYLVSVTATVESPMKLYVQNQNFTSVLFGSQDAEPVKNIVRFEANLASLDLMDVLPVNNKAPKGWKITDFNDLMN